MQNFNFQTKQKLFFGGKKSENFFERKGETNFLSLPTILKHFFVADTKDQMKNDTMIFFGLKIHDYDGYQAFRLGADSLKLFHNCGMVDCKCKNGFQARAKLDVNFTASNLHD